MLTSIRVSDGIKVIASQATKDDGPFICPKCQSTTILRKGMVKIHHFAHKPPIYCEYGKGESERHRTCKSEIYQNLLKYNDIIVELEKDLGSVVPDVFIDFGENKPKVAIEIQISNLGMERIIKRTSEYNRLGIYVLWLALYNNNLEDDRYSPKLWERWLHAAYYGRVYYWMSELKVIPIHYDEYKLYVNESEWYEDGDFRSAGGYYRRSKRFRTPVKGDIVDISKDFRGQICQSGSFGDIFVPDRKIIVDRQPVWWK